MRILGIGDWCDLGFLYLRLQEEGHDVQVLARQMRAQGIMNGLIPHAASLQLGLDWVRGGANPGMVLFEDVHNGPLQDRLRKEGLLVVGGGSYGMRLEQDRGFAASTWRELGLSTPTTVSFTSYEDALAFLAKEKGCWVYKYNGDRFPSSHTYVGQLPDASDLIAVLQQHREEWSDASNPSFILMQRVFGVEVGIGAWFDGTRFLEGARCIDFEHKRLFPGDLGELTGEMGTLVRYRGGERLFNHALQPLAPRLRMEKYQGWINLNMMVNAHGVWPLEYTCRFGYPGSAILEPLQITSWSDLLLRVTMGCGSQIQTRPEWSVGIVLTAPPFPELRSREESKKSIPVSFRRTITPEEWRHIHFNEIARKGQHLVHQGVLGNLMVVTGISDQVSAARARAENLAQQVVAANLRWRNDIGARFEAESGRQLAGWGWLDHDHQQQPLPFSGNPLPFPIKTSACSQQTRKQIFRSRVLSRVVNW